MWNSKKAKHFVKAKDMWFQSEKAGRSVVQKSTQRSRFLCPKFIEWARENDVYPKMINAFEKQYLNSFQNTPCKKVHAFIQNLMDNRMCEVCSMYAPATEATRVCGVCKRTKKGAEYATLKAIELGKARWKSDKEHLLAKQKATCREKYGTDFPWQNPEVNKTLLRKKTTTMLERYGVSHILQHPEFHLKQQIACGKIKTLHAGGRMYQYQGYEDFAIRKLVERYGSENVISQYDYEFPSTNIGYLPDLYLKNLGFYIEVKSEYTLLRDCDFDKNVQKSKNCEASGILVAWFVVYKVGVHRAVRLPKDWHNWSKKKIISYLKSQAPSRQ